MWHEQFREILRREYKTRKLSRPQLSLRAFATHLGVSSAWVSLLVSDKKLPWSVTPQKAKSVLDHLRLTDKERRRLLVAMGFESEIGKKALTQSEFEGLLDWKSTAILIAFDLAEEHQDPTRLASRIGLSTQEIHEQIERLLEHGLLMRNESGRVSRSSEYLTFEPTMSHSLVQRLHRQMLSLSERALGEIDWKERYFNAVTFAGTQKNAERVRKEIDQFLDRITSIAEDRDGANDEIFHLGLQFFPIRFAAKDQ